MSDTLDPQLAALAQRVARMTKLRRAERGDVERELTSHFRESVAAGRSSAETIESFGNPTVAARDLRAAAIAKRSPLDRAVGQSLRFTAYALVCIVVVYTAFAAYLHFQSPVIKVDTLAAYRARLASPTKPEDNAWPLYRSAFLALGLALADPEQKSEGAIAVKEGPFPGMPEWNAAVAWVEAPARQEALATLRTAASRPVFGFPAAREFDPVDTQLYGETRSQQMRTIVANRNDPVTMPLLGVVLPHLESARSAGQILSIDALRAAERGDGDRFIDDIEAIMRMSAHVADGRMLIGDLVGMGIRALATNRAVAVLEWKPDLLNGAQLARLQRVFESVPPQLGRLDLGAERLLWIDFEQRCFTDDGSGSGWFRLDRSMPLINSLEPSSSMMRGFSGDDTAGAMSLAAVTVSGPAAALFVADRRTTHDFFERFAKQYEEASALPLRDIAQISAIDHQLNGTLEASSASLLVPRLMMPSFGRAAGTYLVDRASRDAAVATCAVLRFRADTGAWPERAEDLSPKYLPAVPRDPWTDTPLRMATDADGFRMWSTGEDGRDDGGDPSVKDHDEYGGKLATTRAFRNDTRASSEESRKFWFGRIPDVDWVWYAPRGNFERWASNK
jgi:hypothetical protein